jgi:hypothetical protein
VVRRPFKKKKKKQVQKARPSNSSLPSHLHTGGGPASSRPPVINTSTPHPTPPRTTPSKPEQTNGHHPAWDAGPAPRGEPDVVDGGAGLRLLLLRQPAQLHRPRHRPRGGERVQCLHHQGACLPACLPAGLPTWNGGHVVGEAGEAGAMGSGVTLPPSLSASIEPIHLRGFSIDQSLTQSTTSIPLSRWAPTRPTSSWASSSPPSSSASPSPP